MVSTQSQQRMLESAALAMISWCALGCGEHLEAIQNRFPTLIGKLRVIEISEADYGYRLVVGRKVWAEVVSELTLEQTWSNFKNQVAMNPDNIRSGYEGALHRIWTIMYGLQPQPALHTPVGCSVAYVAVE
jgi:hypothetical protein